jgi:hypothetical protein
MIGQFDTEVLAPDAGDQGHRLASFIPRADSIDRHVMLVSPGSRWPT